MHFDDALERLAVLPDPLPASAEILVPLLVDGVSRRPPRTPPAGRPGRPAAVLALLFPDEAGMARVVLTERTTGGRNHGGEVSFPGGKAEPSDADAVATALREAHEEIALDASREGVRVVGILDTVWIPVSDFAVRPVLAVVDRRPLLRASPMEVARIFDAPIETFLPEARIEIVERTIGGWPLRYGTYLVEGLSVWGATARILSQIGAILAD